MDVDVLATPEVRATQGPLVAEPGLLVRTASPIVPGIDVQADPLEPELAEAEVADGAERIGPVALVPLAFLADGDPELGVAVLEVEAVQADRPDRSSSRPAGR